MALKPREVAILWTTVSVFLLAVLWFVGIEPIYTNYSEVQELLETEEKKFRENRDILKGAKQIERDFDRIKAAIPRGATDERSARDAFSEDVDREATKMLGSKPSLGTVQVEEMKDVPGFSFLSFAIRANGNLSAISNLLKAFDQRGYLIRKVVLNQKDIDNPELSLDLELARIVQIEEPKREGGRRSPFGSKGRPR